MTIQHSISARPKSARTVPLRRLIASAALLGLFAQGAQASCQYLISNEWNTGFTGAIRITNDTGSAVSTWNISWQYAGANRITNSWNATLGGNNPYSATPLGWNASIQPGQSVEFGFQGNKNGGATETPTLSGSLCNTVIASSAPSSTISSTASSAPVPSSSAPSSLPLSSSSAPSSRAAPSSISSQSGQQCNWYGTLYPLCVNTQSGWDWENSASCIAASTCSQQPAPYGIVGATSSRVSSSSSAPSTTSSSIPSSSSSVASVTAYRGVNLAGADFGEGFLPGIYETHYIYPDQTSVDYFKSKQMNTVRLPFRWERLQRSLLAEFDATELARLDGFVTATTAKGIHVLLDPHNYARYHGQLVGSSAVPNSALANFWSRLAQRYKSNPHVIFGLMNEPHSMPTEQWVSAANDAIAAIRATGANNLILVPGNAWTGAHSWYNNWYGTPNASAMLGIQDSGNNVAFDVHQYLDPDASGTSPACVSTSIGVERLTAFTNWLYTNNKRGFLGEFAGGDNAICNQALTNMLQYMDEHPSVWIGWTWWAAGPWWDDYMYSIEPTASGGDKPQMQLLTPYLP